MNTQARRSRAQQRGAIEQSNALTEAFPLIAAGVLVIVGIVLFVTVLWPESETDERPRVTPAPKAAPREPVAQAPVGSSAAEAPRAPLEGATASVEAPKAPAETPKAPAEIPKASVETPKAAAETPQATSAAQADTPAAPPTRPTPGSAAVAAANAPSSVDAMVEAAIAGDDAQRKRAMKQLASQHPPHGDRTRARELNSKGLAQMRSGHYAEAIPLFEAAHRADAGDAEVRENLGYALLKADRIDDARAALLSTLEIAPQRASAWGSLGFVYAKQGHQAEAVKLILTAYSLAADRRKAAEVYRRQAKTDADPKVRAMLTEAVTRLNQAR